MSAVTLLHGQVSFVDDDDMPVISGFRWRTSHHRDGRIAAVVAGGNGVIVLMHRLILSPPPDMVVDHIDGNPLNNRRENLRICTPAENSRNRRKHSNNRSGQKGVYIDSHVVARGGKHPWRAEISLNCVKYCLGSYATQEEAAEAYRRAATEYHGEFGRVA